jgi:hypothetical protein
MLCPSIFEPAVGFALASQCITDNGYHVITIQTLNNNTNRFVTIDRSKEGRVCLVVGLVGVAGVVVRRRDVRRYVVRRTAMRNDDCDRMRLSIYATHKQVESNARIQTHTDCRIGR